MRKIFLLFTMLMVATLATYAQNRTITGVVTDKTTNEPLIGVSITVKGSTTAGTATDANGKFSIKVTNLQDVVLRAKYIGYDFQEQNVPQGQTNINFKLAVSANNLSEVVIVGYGTQTKGSLTGSIVSVDMKAIEDLPVSNLGVALAGRYAGVGVSGGTSRPGQATTITIRNPFVVSKDGGTTNPLYVIDDVQYNDGGTYFNTLDISEVENVSILKDAAAAIYGIAGAQGVVVVKTKRGKVGKPTFSYNGSTGYDFATKLPSMMTGYQQALYMNDLNYANGKIATDPTIYTQDELDYFSNNNTDWLKTAFKPAMNTKQSLNVSGGSETATYFAGMSYFTQNGNYDNISSNKWTYRGSVDFKGGQRLKVGISVAGDIEKVNAFELKQGGSATDNDIIGLVTVPQFTPIQIDGNYLKLTSSSNQNTIDAFNFFALQNLNGTNNNQGVNFHLNLNAEYQIPGIKGLAARFLYGRNLSNTFAKEYGPNYNLYSYGMLGTHSHIYGGSVTGVTTETNNGSRIYIQPAYVDSYQFNGFLTYVRDFGKHSINALVTVEQAETTGDSVEGLAATPIDGANPYVQFTSGTQSVTEKFPQQSARLAYLGRIDYNYAGKYLLQFQGRFDSSTKFSPQNYWGFFPSVSAGWLLSEENFFKNSVKFVDLLKFRVSAGHLGSDATKAFAYLQLYDTQANNAAVFGGNNARNNGVVISGLPNPNVHWDDVNKYNVGIDAQFLKSRLAVTAEGFYDHHYNMLSGLTASVPLLVGGAVGSENFAVINGYGYELSANWNDRVGKDLTYHVGGFFGWSDATAVNVDVAPGVVGTFQDPNGKSTDLGIVGLVYTGMFRTQADVDNYLAVHPGYTLFGAVPKPGMLIYEDIASPKTAATGNNFGPPDGKIDASDITTIAPHASNHYGYGLNLGFGYKGLRLETVISGSFGGQAQVEGNAQKAATATTNKPAFWADHWSLANPNAAYPNPAYSAEYNQTSAFWFRSSFTCVMKSMNLSYTVPQSITSRIGVNGVRVYLNAINPFNFYNPYNYRDNLGSNYDIFPQLRTFTAGLSLSLQ
jgi:TonB-linked SusC/RagA family outer membrane protein